MKILLCDTIRISSSFKFYQNWNQCTDFYLSVDLFDFVLRIQIQMNSIQTFFILILFAFITLLSWYMAFHVHFAQSNLNISYLFAYFKISDFKCADNRKNPFWSPFLFLSLSLIYVTVIYCADLIREKRKIWNVNFKNQLIIWLHFIVMLCTMPYKYFILVHSRVLSPIPNCPLNTCILRT